MYLSGLVVASLFDGILSRFGLSIGSFSSEVISKSLLSIGKVCIKSFGLDAFLRISDPSVVVSLVHSEQIV